MRTRFVSQAEKEFAEAALYYLDVSAEIASRFVDEVEQAIAELTQFPLRSPIAVDDIRVRVLQDFPFSIYFRALSDEVRILAVAHHARHPNFWSERWRNESFGNRSSIIRYLSFPGTTYGSPPPNWPPAGAIDTQTAMPPSGKIHSFEFIARESLLESS